MLDLKKVTDSLRDCPCGRKHEINIRSLEIGYKNTGDTGRILREAEFGKKLHVVADKNTLKAAEGIMDALRAARFRTTLTLFDDLQIADTNGVERVKRDLFAADAEALLSVGTGSLNDICRFNAAELKMPFAIYATAPSMDGFASVMAPITQNGFKRTYPAKAPEVIIADSDVLAKSPAVLKAAGLGDLLGKYTAHADWEVAACLTGEYYCDQIASLTRAAVDDAAELARRADSQSPEFAASLMEALVLSGLAMLLSGCTRPASGAEHHIAHFWEMQYALMGRPQVFHGKKVGIAAGLVADVYNKLATYDFVHELRRDIDWDALAPIYGSLLDECRTENTPNPVDQIVPGSVEANWETLRAALARVPSGDEIRDLIRKTGGAATCAEADIPLHLEEQGLRYGRYARFRMTMMRVLDILEEDPIGV
ncbi:MAG: sn-glycerol-1-phosphate dehydrogenase [Ruminococcaceae bacterium]|nr:sn-glycerol-1-phosphate dehydrogenase [Oscillospiraceae bacterium]